MLVHGNKKIVGFTAGNFDILHPGYIYTFQTAKKHCDFLMVFLQNDPSLDRENKYTPVVPRAERYNALMEMESVDAVYAYQSEEELLNLIDFFKPDVRILGEDYIGKRFTGDNLPPKIIYTSRAHGWSTTKLKNDVTIQTLKNNPNLLLSHPDILESIKNLKYDGDE
jgi:glycerol-3-phosphate cytidylyltransferase|tara:strand:- start:246 stop:746 length:501 start_codon:yes stop_codon:yes gene_type:complete